MSTTKAHPLPVDSDPLTLCLIIPLYNEAESISGLCQEIEGCVFAPFIEQIILVDDASVDQTWSVLRDLAAGSAKITVVRHRHNLGQSAAIATGMMLAGAEIVVTLDGDGQNVPADIPQLLDALTPDVDCVCGVRTSRDDPAVKVVTSRVANRVRQWILGDQIKDTGCSLRVIRRNALAEIPRFNGMHRFLPSMLEMLGFRVVQIPVRHRPRVRGESKYGVGNRLWKGIVDCMVMVWFRRNCIPQNRMNQRLNCADTTKQKGI